LIRERIVTSRSKLSNQHQGHDAILEEINKTLKFLVPAIPLEIAARNYTKFLKLRTNFFNVIGYNESEMHGRTCPSFTAESCRFRVRIRKTEFVNPNVNSRVFQDISGEWMLRKDLVKLLI
jgi:hypothetical protein